MTKRKTNAMTATAKAAAALARESAGESAAEATPAPAPRIPTLDDPSLYMNRELSLLEFQRRVLEEARDPGNRLLERVKFAFHRQSPISTSFSWCGWPRMKQKLEKGSQDLSIDGKTVTEQLAAVRASVDQLDGAALRLLPECNCCPAWSSTAS